MNSRPEARRASRRLSRWWLLVVLACDSVATTSSGSNPERAALAFAGGDVSALERLEQAGAVFRDGGQTGDAIAILRSHGANAFRLRVFVSPDGSEVQVNDLAYTLRMAARVKAAGALLLLDLHYSDTWADPGHQEIPAGWVGLELDSLEARVESYTGDVIAALLAAGALPDIVQVGNEVDAGFLWPLGRVGGAYDTPEQWDAFTRLLKAGIRGIHGALAPGDSVRIMLHYSQGGSAGGTQWFLDHVNARAVPYDLLGLSYYPWWHGGLNDLRANLQAIAFRYGVDVMIVETSYPWRSGGWESSGIDSTALSWPISPQGQAQFLRDLRGAVLATPGGHGLGVVWWYPEAIQVTGLFIYAGGSLALFDPSGNVLPAASELRGETN
jgi:arabinogalactan endo-1,4-beta-galactosidase